MSVDIDWDALTKGPDGQRFAEAVRSFVHERFQQTTLPRFIKSVSVRAFDFGSVCPELEIKDVCDPLPDFYEDDSENEFEDEAANEAANELANELRKAAQPANERPPLKPSATLPLHSPPIPGGTSRFHSFATGLSTPLAAVAGAGYGLHPTHQHSVSSTSVTPPSTASSHEDAETFQEGLGRQAQLARNEDVQIVWRLRYNGDIKLSLTAELLLDYPMPAFISLPVHLNIVGAAFDGIAVTALIRKKIHFAFLGPEDAEVLLGDQGTLNTSIGSLDDDSSTTGLPETKLGGLLHQIRVESEIGHTEEGRAGLKNVGKVEKFVLDQVRIFFEDDLVWPSFWTFLL